MTKRSMSKEGKRATGDNPRTPTHHTRYGVTRLKALAGGPHPERRWGVPVDVAMPHTGATALIEFGSSLDEHSCDESFGVDDVQVHIR